MSSFGPGGIFIHKTNKYGLHFIPWDTYEGRIDPLEFDFTPPNLRVSCLPLTSIDLLPTPSSVSEVGFLQLESAWPLPPNPN